MLCAVGSEHEELGQWIHFLPCIQQRGPQTIAHWRAAWLARQYHIQTAGSKKVREQPEMSRLAAAVYSFERNESSRH
jgi:hypothetical protein